MPLRQGVQVIIHSHQRCLHFAPSINSHSQLPRALPGCVPISTINPHLMHAMQSNHANALSTNLHEPQGGQKHTYCIRLRSSACIPIPLGSLMPHQTHHNTLCIALAPQATHKTIPDAYQKLPCLGHRYTVQANDTGHNKPPTAWQPWDQPRLSRASCHIECIMHGQPTAD